MNVHKKSAKFNQITMIDPIKPKYQLHNLHFKVCSLDKKKYVTAPSRVSYKTLTRFFEVTDKVNKYKKRIKK